MGLYGAVLTVLGTKGVGAGCDWISGGYIRLGVSFSLMYLLSPTSIM